MSSGAPPNAAVSDRARLEQVEVERARGEQGLSALVELLATPSWTVRRAAVTALAELAFTTAPELCRALAAQRHDEGQVAGLVDALSTTRADVDAAVAALLAHDDPAVVCDAVQILGRRGSSAELPAIVRLTEHSNENVALAAIEALGRIGGTPAVDRLIELTGSGDLFRAFPAIDALGRLGDARAVPELASLLRDPFYGAEAARALGRLGHAAAAPSLIDLVANGSKHAAHAAAIALVEIHAHSTEKFGAAVGIQRAVVTHPRVSAIRARALDGLKARDALERAAAARMLGWLSEHDQVPELIALLDGPEEAAASARKALAPAARSGDPRVVEALTSASSQVRRQLLPLLGGVTWAVPVMLECLDDPDRAVRVAACDALARTGAKSAVPKLFEHLEDPDLGVSQSVISAIQSLGGAETEQRALAALRSDDIVLRRAALRIVCYFAYTSGFDAVLDALASDDDRLRDIAVGGISLFEDPRVPDVLLGLVEHASARLRAGAVRAMGHAPTEPRLFQRLLAALRDEDAWVRYFACQALGRSGRPEAAAAVLACIDDPAGQVRVGVVDALARLPGTDAVMAIRAAASSEDADVRRAALVAMGPSRLPENFELLAHALSDADPATRLVVLSSIAQYDGMAAVAALSTAARGDPEDSVRKAALELLATHASPASTSALLDLLFHEPEDPRLVLALARSAGSRVALVADALENADPRVASALTAVLSRLDTPEARAAILGALASEHVATRRAAAEALSASHDAEATEALARAAAGDPDPEVRRMCGLALS